MSYLTLRNMQAHTKYVVHSTTFSEAMLLGTANEVSQMTLDENWNKFGFNWVVWELCSDATRALL